MVYYVFVIDESNKCLVVIGCLCNDGLIGWIVVLFEYCNWLVYKLLLNYLVGLVEK